MKAIEKIKAEIERRREIHFKDYHINKNGNSADYGACNALTQLLTFIDSLEEEPISNDLEEAACEYADGENPTCPCEECLIKTFKEGAQWQKEQIIDKACEWLNNYFKGVAGGSVYIDDFKKAMEE